MRKLIIHICAIVLPVAATVGGADTLELKNGAAIQGRYAGGTTATINMQTAQGVLAVSTADALVLRVSPPPPVVVIPPPPPISPGPVSVPAGPELTLRIGSQISSKEAPGKQITRT